MRKINALGWFEKQKVEIFCMEFFNRAFKKGGDNSFHHLNEKLVYLRPFFASPYK